MYPHQSFIRRPLPSSVSGYELPALSKSASNYSVHSGTIWPQFYTLFSFIQPCHYISPDCTLFLLASSCGSSRSVRSSGSFRSISSVKSNGSGSSWFSVNSLSSFQCASLDKGSNNKQPRVRRATTWQEQLTKRTEGTHTNICIFCFWDLGFVRF